jgi:hypothetical protein
MVTDDHRKHPGRREPILAAIASGLAAGCGSFQDPNVVVDLRILAMTASPPDQVLDVDLTQPVMPQALLAKLVATEVCVLIADPALDRRLLWSLSMCSGTAGGRCGVDDEVPLGGGLLDDPDTTVPEPRLCVTVEPDAKLLGILLQWLQNDSLHGLGGVDYSVQLRVGGEDGDRDLDQYASKTVRVAPRIPMARTANTNPSMAGIDAALEDQPGAPVPLVRCPDNTAPPTIAPDTRLRLTPIEPDGTREVYVVPTLDGKTQTFTESLTYQWVASAGGFSSGSTGGPHDLSGNPAPLFTDYRAPAAADLDGPTDVSLWIVQRDERLGETWYEGCLRVVP